MSQADVLTLRDHSALSVYKPPVSNGNIMNKMPAIGQSATESSGVEDYDSSATSSEDEMNDHLDPEEETRIYQRQLSYPPVPNYDPPKLVIDEDSVPRKLTPMDEMTEPPSSALSNGTSIKSRASTTSLASPRQNNFRNSIRNQTAPVKMSRTPTPSGQSSEDESKKQQRKRLNKEISISPVPVVASNQLLASPIKSILKTSPSPTRRGVKFDGTVKNPSKKPDTTEDENDESGNSSLSENEEILEEESSSFDLRSRTDQSTSHRFSLSSPSAESSPLRRLRSSTGEDVQTTDYDEDDNDDNKDIHNKRDVVSEMYQIQNENPMDKVRSWQVSTPTPGKDEPEAAVHMLQVPGTGTKYQKKAPNQLTVNFASDNSDNNAEDSNFSDAPPPSPMPEPPRYSALADTEFATALDDSIAMLHQGSKVGWEHRVKMADELSTSIREVSPQALLKNMSQLIPLVTSIASDSHFRVSLSILNTITLLGDRLRDCKDDLNARNCDLTWLVRRLCTICGESRSTLRAEGALALSHVIRGGGPKVVVEPLYTILACDSGKKGEGPGILTAGPRIKTAALDAVTFALLMYPRDEFDLHVVARQACKTLWNAKRRVRQASLECLAVVAHAMGPQAAVPLMRRFIDETKHELSSTSSSSSDAKSAGETTRNVPTPGAAVSARVSRHVLPSPAPAGLVEYAVQIPNMRTTMNPNNNGRGKQPKKPLTPIPKGDNDNDDNGGRSSTDGTDTVSSTPSHDESTRTGTMSSKSSSVGKSVSSSVTTSGSTVSTSNTNHSTSSNGDSTNNIDLEPVRGSGKMRQAAMSGANGNGGIPADIAWILAGTGPTAKIIFAPPAPLTNGAHDWVKEQENMNGGSWPASANVSKVATSVSSSSIRRPRKGPSALSTSNGTSNQDPADLPGTPAKSSWSSSNVISSYASSGSYVTRYRSSAQLETVKSDKGYSILPNKYSSPNGDLPGSALGSAHSHWTPRHQQQHVVHPHSYADVSAWSSGDYHKPGALMLDQGPPKSRPFLQPITQVKEKFLESRDETDSDHDPSLSTLALQRRQMVKDYVTDSSSFPKQQTFEVYHVEEDLHGRDGGGDSAGSSSTTRDSGVSSLKSSVKTLPSPPLDNRSIPGGGGGAGDRNTTRKSSVTHTKSKKATSGRQTRDFDETPLPKPRHWNSNPEIQDQSEEPLSQEPLGFGKSIEDLDGNHSGLLLRRPVLHRSPVRRPPVVTQLHDLDSELVTRQTFSMSTSQLDQDDSEDYHLRPPEDSMSKSRHSFSSFQRKSKGSTLPRSQSNHNDISNVQTDWTADLGSTKGIQPRRVYKGSFMESRGRNNVQVSVFPPEMKPVDSPKHALGKALMQIDSKDWDINIEGLKLLVRLTRYHPDSLRIELHNINMIAIQLLPNPRSQVSRAACLFFKELFNTQRKLMESDTEKIVEKLFDKTANTNKFIQADSQSALEAVVDHISSFKVISCFDLLGARHKNPIVRTVTSRLVVKLVQQMGADRCLSEIPDRLLPMLVQFLQEGSLETRTQAKLAFSELKLHPVFETQLRKHVSPDALRHGSKSLASIKSDLRF